VATLWTANGKPAEPSESVISGRESRQLFMLPYHGQWVEPPRYISSLQHDYYYGKPDYYIRKPLFGIQHLENQNNNV
jgi:hypothetical protein